MNAIKVLTPILLICFCWTFQLDAQKATYNFSNRNRTHDILLSVNGKPKATIKKAQKGSLDLNIGDVVTVSVPGHDALTWYPIYITEQVPEADPIIINPNVVWFANDSRSVGTPVLNYYYNTRGIHIHDFDPQIVSSSFTTSRIFEGISKECIDYELSDNSQFIYTEGFFYDDNRGGEENVVSTFTRNVDDYKRSFHAKLGASFPIPKIPGAKGSFDFGYKKTNKQTLGNTSYNWSESQKVFTYDILIQDISRVRMHPDFLDYIEQMAKKRHTVQDFVKKFGTHYPTKISYGGQYFKYVSMEATDYAQAEKEGWDVGLGAKLSEDGTKTVKRTRGGWTETGSNESSQVASIDLQFGQNTTTSEQNQLKKTRRKAMYIGGTGIGDDWSVSPDNATAVKVEIARIEELFYPHILKNDWTESKCKKWRDAIRAEVQKQIDDLPTIKPSSGVKTRRFRVRTQKLHKTYEVDDTDKRIKGHVWLVSKTPSVKAVEPSYQNGGAISSIWKEDKFADLFNKGPIAPMHQSKHGKWQVFEQTSDANGKFAPIKFEAGGHIYEAGIFGGQDRLDFTRGQQIELGQLSDQVVPHVMKLENNKTLAERYHVEITLEFKPTYDFGDLFGTFNNNRSAQKALQTLPNAKVSRANWKQPIERSAKPVKFYSKNSLSLAQAQAIAKQNGWTLATGNDIQAAFIQHKLDVYAFGQLADGRFAVPVQKDHSNFKKGPNIGAVGGNQGFFYTVPTTSPKATPVATTTATKTTGVSKGSDGPEFKKTPWLDQDFIRIQNKSNNTLYVHNQWEQVYGGPIQADWFSAQWKFIPYGGLKFIGNFQNRANPNLYLSNNGGKVEVIKDPANLQDGNILWTILPEKDGWLWIGNSAAPNEFLYIDNDQLKVGVPKGDLSGALWKVEFGPISGSGIVTPPTFKAPEPVNVALNKPTKQSSTHAGYSSKFAVDGNTKDQKEGAYYAYAHTQRDRNPWWEVDLGANYKISQINIFNVSEFYKKHRMEGLYINVSKTPFVNNWDGVGFADNVFPDIAGEYKGNATGRYVRIYLGKKESLNVSEVQVMGIPE